MRYLIGNWKSNENNTQTKLWLETFKNNQPPSKIDLSTIVCMPFTNLAEANRYVAEFNLPIQIGAQDVSAFPSGSHTGGITAGMLSELIGFCLVGHSERRQELGEDSDMVTSKAKILLESSITPIVCIDEPYLEEQVKSLYTGKVAIEKCLFAYEPLLAIGSGKPAVPDDVERVAAKINFLTDSVCPVIYGGSVGEANITSFASLPNISGVLVGTNSLDPKTFVKLMSCV